jgi:hypothetical protein
MVDEDKEREVAIKRLKARRDFMMHLGAYVIINGMIVVIWAFTGHGRFWPIWLILFWGVGLAFHGWSTYFAKPISEAEIRREMGKGP